MQISIEKFKENLLTTLRKEDLIFDISKIKFIITPIKEDNVKYNSVDDYIRLGMLEKTDLANHYFNLEEAVDFLALPNNRFPLWIKVIFKESLNETLVFELKTSMRYRTPTQLKYIETGHPPFIFEKKDND